MNTSNESMDLKGMSNNNSITKTEEYSLVNKNKSTSNKKPLKKYYHQNLRNDSFYEFVKNIFMLKKNTILNIIALILNIYAISQYYLSLEGCVGTQIDCLKILTIDKFYGFLYDALRGAFATDIVLILAYFKKISLFNVIYPAVIYYFFYLMDHGSDLAKHGQYNFIGYFTFIFSFFLVSLFFCHMYLFYKRGKKKIFFCILLSIFSLFLLTYIILLFKISCRQWNKGLKKLKLIDDPKKDSCYFVKPNKCYMNAFDGLIDISKYIGGTCDKICNSAKQKEKLFSFLNKEKFNNTTKIGFPITTTSDFALETQKNIEHFSERVLSRMVDMDKISEIDENLKPEVYIDFSKNDPEVHIELNKKDLLSEERKKISTEKISKFDNILFIFIDALSRQHFNRKMKKLKKFLEHFMHETNKNSKDYNLYQFMKYHTFAPFTQKNLQPMFYGEKMDKSNSNGTSINKFLKQQGFITGQSSNLCSKELFVTMNNCLNYVEFEDFDHENVALFCDPSYYDRTNPYPLFQGSFSVIRRCLYKKDSYEYVLEYGKQFWEKYLDNKKYLRLSFIDAHEGTGEVVKYLDDPLTKFLFELNENKYLKNTVIFFVSDHGNGMPSIYNVFKSKDYEYENVLGLFLIFTHGYKNETGIKNLENNQQVFVTPYDIHDTLIDIIYDDKNKTVASRNGDSLFLEVKSMERNCEKYSDMQEGLCRCIKY